MRTTFNKCDILQYRLNQTLVSNVCKAALMSLFWSPKELNELPGLGCSNVG